MIPVVTSTGGRGMFSVPLKRKEDNNAQMSGLQKRIFKGEVGFRNVSYRLSALQCPSKISYGLAMHSVNHFVLHYRGIMQHSFHL